jgi:uncharacterized protein YaiL (DUF2058 family)
MGNTLFDQLKKSGLVDKKKATAAKKEKHKRIKQKKGKKQQVKPLLASKRWAQEAQAEKTARDRELNRKRKQDSEQKSIAAQVKQLILQNRIEEHAGGVGFNFVDGKQVQRLYVTKEIQEQLTGGVLAIVKLDKTYELIPSAVAEKVKLRDSACVLLCNVIKQEAGDEDDPYAEYQVPDDLMW